MLDMDRQEKDEIKMETETCKNCFWWKRYQSERIEEFSNYYGTCENADNSKATENAYNSKANNLVFDDEGCTILISTGKNFGCNQFEDET